MASSFRQLRKTPWAQTPEGRAGIDLLERNYPYDHRVTPWLLREYRRGRLVAAPSWLEDVHGLVQAEKHNEPDYVKYYQERLGRNRPDMVLFEKPEKELDGRRDLTIQDQPDPVQPGKVLNLIQMLNYHDARQQPVDIMNHTFDEMMPFYDQWKNEYRRPDPDAGEPVFNFPDQWTMRRVTDRDQLLSEGEEMQNCIPRHLDTIAQGRHHLYSLRDPQNAPHANVFMTPGLDGSWEGGKIHDIRGKQNEPPRSEYANYLKQWFGTFGTPAQAAFEPGPPGDPGSGDPATYGLHDPRYGNWQKFADKFNDFLNNPQARPDLQTPEAQQFLQQLQGSYLNDKTDELMPWLTREWKKGRIKANDPHVENLLRFDAGPDYEYDDPYEAGGTNTFHRLMPEDLNHWADWYRSDHPSRQGVDIMQMQTPQLHQTIKDWDAEMREKAQGQAQLRGDIEHSYPDGWTVQKLTTPEQLEEEGEKMGHCVGGYYPSVQAGQSLIYSLRDHQNEPHATWEVEPKWFESDDPEEQRYAEPYTWTDELKARKARGELHAIPNRGTMVQVQGKGNHEPIDDYKQRIKDYFGTMPEEDRPTFEGEEYSDLEDLGYGDDRGRGEPYGLSDPKDIYHWPDIVENLHDAYSPSARGSGYDAEDLVRIAHEQNALPEVEKHVRDLEEKKRDEEQEEFDRQYSDLYSMEGYENAYPRPDPDEYPDNASYQKAEEEWDEAYYKAEQDVANEQWREWWNSTPTSQFTSEFEDALARHKLQQKREQERGSHVVAAKKGFPHQHFTTGQFCNCTFTKHLEQPKITKARIGTPLTCETCGDPLEYGKCKRCNWGGWSNAMGTDNPPDPTRDVKPAIQAGRITAAKLLVPSQ